MNGSASRTIRSFLYVPATAPKRFDKAVDSGAHAVIVDLEDAVAAQDKPAAREILAATCKHLRDACDHRGTELLVRINAHGSHWHADDAQACESLPIDGVVVPKPADPRAISQLANRLPGRRMYLLVESLAGFENIAAIARVPQVTRLMFGAADLMLEFGTRQDGAPLHHFRSLLTMHSRLAGLPSPVDGVCTALDHTDLLSSEIDRAKDFGFGGKLCVHPSQIEAVNRQFAPSAAQRAWALRVCEVADTANGAAVRVDGALVDAPILEQAKRILAEAT